MKSVWEAINYCKDNGPPEGEGDPFGYWWNEWVGEKNCQRCGEGTLEIKLHTEYPIKGWKEGGVIGKEGDEIRSSVRITYPYFECSKCDWGYSGWMHSEIENESRVRDDPKFREWMELSAEERYGSKKKEEG
jgi:NADH:ubiquinone oxidoreductase subunit